MFLGLTWHAYAETNNGTRVTNDEPEFGKVMYLGLMRHAYDATAKQSHVYGEREFRKLMLLGLTWHAYAETNNGTSLMN